MIADFRLQIADLSKVVLMTTVALGLAGCGKDAAKASAPEPLRGAQVETLKLETVPDEIEAPGTVQSVATAQLAARTMGTVLEVAAREGDAVRRGQLLVRLDDGELGARRQAAAAAYQEATAAGEEVERAVAAAQAQADVARKTYERFQYLKQQNSVSPQEFDEVEGRYRAATEGLAQAKARRQQVGAMRERAQSESQAASAVAGYTRVTAPFDGVVVRRSVEPGSVVMPGTPLLVVEDKSKYRMEVTLDAASASGMQRGTTARVEVDALPGRSFEGKVTEVQAGAEAGSQTLQAKIELPSDPALRSGLFGRAWFRRGEKAALAIPRTALVERGQLKGVYALDKDQVARFRLITVGAKAGDHVEVLSGLAEGERIVLNPGTQSIDGRKVESR